MLKNNIDLNIWDRWSYQTEGKVTGGWVINTYVIPQEGAGYGTGRQTEHSLHLRERDAKVMRLGEDTDEDFWIDSESLLYGSGDVPRRVRVWLESVMTKIADEEERAVLDTRVAS